MKYTFEIEETLSRQVVIDSDTLDEALREFYTKFDTEEISLDSKDFACGKLSLVPKESTGCAVEQWGERLKEEGLTVVIDRW